MKSIGTLVSFPETYKIEGIGEGLNIRTISDKTYTGKFWGV